MGRIRLTRAGWSRAGTLTGAAMASCGAGLGLGLAVGLAVGGVLLAAYCLFLADTDGGGP
ncbi:hypothetical protein QBA54_31960 [Streptomyces sp. B21-108]|uniref:hypothetical protein n=1 Tax=Streptomyces sp. B21-108 TaxID=3039419 RepID=UPI002FF24963